MAMNNSLAEVHPELVSEWSEKNLPLTPDDITFGSNKKVWWRGACGHEWQTTIVKDNTLAKTLLSNFNEIWNCIFRSKSIIMISITQFKDCNMQDAIDLVLHFQNDGTRPLVTVNDQPDLLNIKECYLNAGGNFWVATDNGKLAGSIGIMPYGKEVAVLKKFFVYEDYYQGEPVHLGQKLYAELLSFAKAKGFTTILLDTKRNTARVHKFYEKAGFKKVEEHELPLKFSHPYKDCDFFLLNL